MGTETTAAGFWSYARDDDSQDGGRIKGLADALRNAYSLQTGQELKLFVDRDAIEWGQEWRERIDEALAETTFFIPVITPRYFQREECRRELLTFAGHAKSLGREELVLPIYYVHVNGVENGQDTEDEAVALVSRMNFDDWRELRFEDENSSAYRKRVSELATRLADISREVAKKDESDVDRALSEVPSEDDLSPGLLDEIIAGEESLPRLNEVLDELAAELQALNETTDAGNPALTRAMERGGPSALFALREFGRTLRPHADRIEELGSAYAAQLVSADPALLASIRLAEMNGPDDQQREAFASIRGMRDASAEAVAEMRDLLETLGSASTLSKDLRGPLSKIRVGLRNVVDGQAVIEEWSRRATQVEEAWDASESQVEGAADAQT